MSRYRVVDADGHVEEPAQMWPKYLEPRFHPMAPKGVRDTQGRRRRMVGGRMVPYIPDVEREGAQRRAGGRDPRARLADMDSEGIDISVIYPSAGLHFASIDRLEVSVALSRAYNDWLRDFCSAAPRRLIGIGLAPQLDVYETVQEIRRAIEDLGFKGVFLRPNPIGGRTLDNPALDPLWSLLEELDIPATLHEGTSQNVPQAGLDRYDNFMFRHVISHPHEQQMACLSLICGGVLERHPRLRVAFLESGCGWIAYWLERLDHHVKYWGHASMKLSLKPSEYFARQCFISADPDERILPGILDVLGDDTLLFASDYPHFDAIFPGVVAALADRTDVSDASKAKIFWENPARLFNLT